MYRIGTCTADGLVYSLIMTIRESEILATAALDAQGAYLRFRRVGLTHGEATAAAIRCPHHHPMPRIADEPSEVWMGKAMKDPSGPLGAFYARCSGVREAMHDISM